MIFIYLFLILPHIFGRDHESEEGEGREKVKMLRLALTTLPTPFLLPCSILQLFSLRKWQPLSMIVILDYPSFPFLRICIDGNFVLQPRKHILSNYQKEMPLTSTIYDMV